uniref:Transposase n=1 Tax=Heterorhabditis bacteriophora TaxID=37862 RepID=A0A1I7WUH8_HETBA
MKKIQRSHANPETTNDDTEVWVVPLFTVTDQFSEAPGRWSATVNEVSQKQTDEKRIPKIDTALSQTRLPHGRTTSTKVWTGRVEAPQDRPKPHSDPDWTG